MNASSPEPLPEDDAAVGPVAHLVVNGNGSVCVTGLSSLDVVVALQESGSQVVFDGFEPSEEAGPVGPVEPEEPDGTRTTPDRVAADQGP